VQEEQPPDADGWITLRVQFDCVEEACSVVLGLGAHADVIRPESLGERVAAEAAAIVERARARAPRQAPAL
jgi:predicted DNA-binding transcriptional regulator YafY